MLRSGVFVSLFLAVAGAAAEAPYFTILETPRGSPSAYSIGISFPDCQSYPTSFSLTLSPHNQNDDLVQTRAFGTIDVNDLAFANVFDSFGIGYDKDADTWWYTGSGTPFTVPIAPFNGFDLASGAPGSNAFSASFASALPLGGDRVPFLHAVFTGYEGVRIVGEITRNGATYPINASLQWPQGAPDPEYEFVGNPNFASVRVGETGTTSVGIVNRYVPSLAGTFDGAAAPFGPSGSLDFGPLAPNSSFSRDYTFSPVARGMEKSTIDIGPLATTLCGTGVGPLFADDDADNLIDLGVVGPGGGLATVTLSNITPDGGLPSQTDLTLLGYALSGPDADRFSINLAPGAVIRQGESLMMTVSVDPGGAPVGAYEATLTLSTDEDAALGGDGQDHVFQLRAIAVPEPSVAYLLLAAGLWLGAFRFPTVRAHAASRLAGKLGPRCFDTLAGGRNVAPQLRPAGLEPATCGLEVWIYPTEPIVTLHDLSKSPRKSGVRLGGR